MLFGTGYLFKEDKEIAYVRISVRDEAIVKKFPGTLALNHVDFNLKSGEVMALIGENGAGKSTLMNVLMGVLKPEEGEVYLQGTRIEIKSPYECHYSMVSEWYRRIKSGYRAFNSRKYISWLSPENKWDI
ncbi:MAG: ATP-binding cassette domain-containing protein [Lachnospiraceae bacterium]